MTKLRHWIVMATLASLWACGSPEQATVDQFFRAAKDNDTVTLAYMSAVNPPLEVESWKVGEVTSRSTAPFELPELYAKFKEAEKVRNEGLDERKKYFEENQDALEQIIPKLRDEPDYKFRGKLAGIQEEWLRLADERKERERVYQELKRSVDRETSIASKSVMRQIPVTDLRGDIEVTELGLDLKSPDRPELPFKMTLHKYDLKAPDSETVESSRWVVVAIEGASPEAVAAVEEASKASAPLAAAEAGSESSEGEDSGSAAAEHKESTYLPRELRGLARVQTLAPETKVEGSDVISLIKVRNVSKDWISGFTVTEHWYDKDSNAVGSASRTYRERFMPGEVIELELRIQKKENFFQNQYWFSHANGEVNASVVQSFPERT